MTDVRPAPAPAPPSRRPRRHGGRWIASGTAVVIIAAFIVATTWFLQWRSSLHALIDFPGYGSGQSVPVGQSYYFGGLAAATGSDPARTLTIDVRSVRPVVVTDTADADVSVVLCRLSGDGSPTIGSDLSDTRRGCSTLSPFSSGTVRLGYGRDDVDLVLRVTPRHAGTVRVDGVELDYSSGLRHGTQHIGPQVTTRTR